MNNNLYAILPLLLISLLAITGVMYFQPVASQTVNQTNTTTNNYKPTLINNGNNNFTVANLTASGSFNKSFCGTEVYAIDNFINPNFTGITINNVLYGIAINFPVMLNNMRAGCYVELLNISNHSTTQSVTLRFFSNFSNNSTSQPLIVANNSTTINLTLSARPLALISVYPSNYTSLVALANYTNVTPSTPSNFTSIDTISIAANGSISPATFDITAALPCGQTSIQPFILENGTWVKTGSAYDALTCTVYFFAPANNPVIGFMAPVAQAVQQQPSGAPTSIAQSSQLATSGESSGLSTIALIVLALVVITALVVDVWAKSTPSPSTTAKSSTPAKRTIPAKRSAPSKRDTSAKRGTTARKSTSAKRRR